MQLAFVSAAKIAATLTPAPGWPDGVIMITGTGDHLRPEWPITITGMRNVAALSVRVELACSHVLDHALTQRTDSSSVAHGEFHPE